jgi:hypothetical protein|tara:strand:- start:1093 stop:1503 length:411 start_codon:yes stop_codon:yes gene_type:complete
MNTKQITQLDRAVCKDITNELNTALASLGEKLGVSIRTNGCRYGSTSASIKLEIELLSDEGRPISKEETFLNDHHQSLEIPKEWLGAMLKDPKGKFFYLRGYKQRSYKRPFIIVDAITNQEYVAPKSTVLRFTLAN